MKINPRYTSAFTLIEIMVVVAIIGLLASMAVSNYAKSQSTARLTFIRNNLNVIDQAKIQWAMENKKGDGVVPTGNEIAPYLKGKKFPPEDAIGEVYSINEIGESPTAMLPGKLGDYEANDVISLD